MTGAAAPRAHDVPGHPTGGHGHRGTRAVQRMVEFAPSTGGLALWMQHRDLPQAPETLPPVTTDGETLFYAPAFAARPEAEQTGLVAHAVLHVALRHAQRFLELRQLLGDVDLVLFNTCADALVNSALGHLSWLQLPARAVTLDRLLAEALGLRQAVEKSLLEWDVEQLYRAIDDRAEPRSLSRQDARRVSERGGDKGGGKGGEKGAGQAHAARRDGAEAGTAQTGATSLPAAQRADGPRAAAVRALGAFGTQAAPDLQPDAGAAVAPEREAESAREWSERIARSHAGDGEFSMLRALLADLSRTRTPWPQVLRTLLVRALAPRPAPSWSRPARSWIANQGRAGPHRRMPWEPGIAGTKAVPRLALMVDVSGSIDEGLLERFAREVEAITRRLEASLVLVVGDDRVRHVARIEPAASTPQRGARARLDLGALEFPGGGGTDFTPLLEEADRHRPDIGVVLTDLEGPARWRPRWPVVWAVPAHCAAAAPFGRRIELR